MTKRIMRLTLSVTVPATVGESEVQTAVNAALDEPPCDWDDWLVGEAEIVDVTHFDENPE